MEDRNSNAIIVSNLIRNFGKFNAVDDVSFNVQRGKVFGLLGSNGAGKSTTIKILTTILAPTSGTAIINGYDIVKEQQMVRSSIGYVPQALSADGELTGYENILLSAKLYALKKAERSSRIEELLAFMGLTEDANKLVKYYSGGMIRKLEIAQAILHKPSIIFLDEPTVGLDPVARSLVWHHIENLRQTSDITIILTTHDMEEAERLCDLLGFMSKGKISTIGTPHALKQSLGTSADLNDVFIHYTGNTIKEGDSYFDAKQIRKFVSRG